MRGGERGRGRGKAERWLNIWVERLRPPAAFDCEYLGRLLASRTPGPSPFSPMNCTPAAHKRARRLSTGEARARASGPS